LPVANASQHLQALKLAGMVAACGRGPYWLMSLDAVAALRKRGLKARRLANGLPEWRAAGLPVER